MFDRLGFDGKKHNKGFRRAAAVVLAALLLVTVIRADAVSAYAAEEERITFKVDDEDGREYIDRGWWELYDVYVNEPLTYYVEMYLGGRYPVETVTTYTKTGATAVFRCSENIYGDSQNLLMKAGDTCTATAVFSEPNNTLKPGEHLGFNVQIQGEKAVRGGDLFDLFIGFRVCIRQEVGEIVTGDDGSRYFSETSIDKETWMQTAEGAEDVKSDFDHPTASGYLEGTVAAPGRYSGAKEPYADRLYITAEMWSNDSAHMMSAQFGTIVYKYKWVADISPLAASGGAGLVESDPGNQEEEESEEEPADYEDDGSAAEWYTDEDAPDEPGGEFPVWIPGGIAVVIGAAVIAKRKGKKGGSKSRDKSKEKPPEEEKEDRNRYELRISKDFGSMLYPGEEKKPVYARVVKIDQMGNETTDLTLTRKIQISSPEYLEVTGVQMAGEYKGANITAPVVKDIPEKAAVEFILSGPGVRFRNRMYFKVENAQIEFMQENLGLPAHYDKEARLLFKIPGFPKDAVFTPTIRAIGRRGLKKPPYTVTVEPDAEHEGGYYAVVRDIMPKDKADAGTTEEWIMNIKAESPDGKRKVETDFMIFRIHLGLSVMLEGEAVGCYLRPKKGLEGRSDLTVSDVEPCCTEGSALLLEWDEENKAIVRVAPKAVNCKVTARKVLNDKYSHIGEVNQNHQNMVDALGLAVFPMEKYDEKTGARRIILSVTKACLDRPVRLRADVTFSVTYKEKTYELTKELLLHSMPFRHWESEAEWGRIDKEDRKIQDNLLRIQNLIYNNYMYHLASLYNLINRMLEGYDQRFGFDENQISNVMRIWSGFLDGSFAGANAKAQGLTLADDLAASYAFLQGMRDNGGMLGRIALGICTAGASEHVFFAMDLGEKMYDRVMSGSGDDFGFWDGVKMGVQDWAEGEIQGFFIGGAINQAAKIKLSTNTDIGGTISKKYKSFINSADMKLKKGSKLYAAGSDAMNAVGDYMNGSAKSLKDAMDRSKRARLEAEKAADALTPSPKKLSISELREGKLYKDYTPEQMKMQEDYDIAMAEAMDQVRDLDAARRDVRRGSPDYWEKKKIYEEKCLEVLKNPCAKKQLRALGGSAGLTNRAEFASWRQRFNGDIKNGMLDDYCAATGRPRDEMYFQCVTSNSSADELAGKILPEDLDLTAAQSGTSAKDGGAKWRNDMVVGQTEGNYYLSKSTYRRIYKKDPVTPAEIEKAMQLLEELDITYVAPRMDDKYVGEFNPEAYYELDTVTQKENFGKALEAPTMTQKTIQHKAGEWYRRGDAYYAEAARVEEAAKALGLDLAEGSETYKKIRNLKSRAQGCYVEGTRQVTKTVDKYADPRNDARVARGESDLFTPKHREMQAVSRRVGSRAANEIPPAEFFRYLEKNGMDKYSFAEKMSGLFR